MLIVDDHARFRASARALLESTGFEVVGEAAAADEALRIAGALRPEIVLLDVQLPGPDGFDVAERLHEDHGSPVVILISSRDAHTYGDRVQRAPVAGFISKPLLSADAIRSLLE